MTTPDIAGAADHEHEMSLGDDIARCVHCGFCLQACPTYLELGTETDGPRGRIALIDALTSGGVGPAPSLLSHLDLCLQCRACETACPSGVAFGHIMESARATVLESPDRPKTWALRAATLRQVLPHQRRIRAAMLALRTYQRSPVRRVLRRSGVLKRLPTALAAAESSAPEVPPRSFEPPPQPAGLTRIVALLTGCVMPHLYPRTHEATVRVLNRLGYRVVFPEAQTCCGALSAHAGDRRFASELAQRNVSAFDGDAIEAVIVNSAGCGAAMKDYGRLLGSDAAHGVAAKTRDVLEFVAEHDTGILGRIDATVTYQDSCHLVHAQRITAAPRAILERIPGLELREMAAPDRCCGSAGIYSITQGSMSRRLLANKMRDIATTGATTIATANPGCIMQLEAGVRWTGGGRRVVHVIELLDEAMRAGEVSERSSVPPDP